ncbi:MAG: DUF2089 domain-containing protein [Flavobacteriaceae bacterium]|nr:DUF2089 domain-containing protein [Flavobacteriaceae bacterium]
MNPKLPIHCPACEAALKVSQLLCESCSTSVNGTFSLPLFLKLQNDEQDFILKFLLNSGSLKEMAKQMNISYPTLRNKLDDLIEKIKQMQTDEDLPL